MLFSIALTMLGAWLYGFPGCLVTTLLSIPYHYLMLRYYSDDPAIWNEAFNLFGISTQLLVSGAIALLRHAKQRFEKLNALLEQKVEERTEELRHLQHYIMQNHETAQVMLSHMLLGDIGDSLSNMLHRCDLLLNKLLWEDNPASAQTVKLKEMIKDTINVVQNLEFVDHFLANNDTGFSDAVLEVTSHFHATAGTKFDVQIQSNSADIPKHIQHQLYRITQEAITNAVRHAQAGRVLVQLESTSQAYELSVINDGLPMPEKIESGLGLKLMQHRTRQLGGQIEWGRTSESNTHLRCIIPKIPD